MRLDLPTFERPAKATSAIVGGGQRSARPGAGEELGVDDPLRVGEAEAAPCELVWGIERARGAGSNDGLHASHWQSERR